MTSQTASLLSLPDYPALQQLARALWRDGSVRGASVLVGAGLSKNARRPGEDTPEPPLWSELSDRMISRLYPHDKKAAPSNSLRIAEEYRTYFGQAGLDDFIRSNVPDRSWSPGPLHADLLELPWADVLTTNWDTLLERASENTIEHSYEIVRAEADLTYARSPRIVKLHGSIGDAGPLIFAEEDYRAYPTKYAAFVNLARQVFIENELVLLGFSGDDPNFLEWAGWVRDHLGGSARRIYLVGYLRLERATRKYLEARNIAPIDFAPFVKDLAVRDRHTAAIRLFLEEMRRTKPIPDNNWNLTPSTEFPLQKAGPEAYQRIHKDPVLAKELLEKSLPLLKADRENYPGWLLCPKHYRSRLNGGFNEGWLFRPETLQLLTPKVRAEAAYEVLWRCRIALRPLGPELISAMIEVLDESSSEVDLTWRAEFALALLRHARSSCDDDALEHWAILIEAETQADAAIRQDVQYQRCLRAREKGDLGGLANRLSCLTSDDPVWRLRRAALHCDIGEFAKANKLIREAAADLERGHRLDRRSLWIKARLGWADWILRASNMGNPATRKMLSEAKDFKTLHIDPSGEIRHFEASAEGIQKKRREKEAEIQPAFDAGHYRQGGPPTYFGGSDPDFTLLYELDELIEIVGLPIRINNVNVYANAAIAASDVAFQPTVEWYVRLLRALHDHFDYQFARYFSRISIAQLDDKVSRTLISVIETAIRFWVSHLKNASSPDSGNDQGRARDVLRLLLVTLSRLTVRMSVEHACRTFNFAIDLAKDPLISHPWLLEALGDLIKYAAQAIPIECQGKLAITAIEFPLASEKGTNARFWPSVITTIWNSTLVRELDDLKWDHRIRDLISAARKGYPDREEAILRVAYLVIRKALKPAEEAAFGVALWSDMDGTDNALPANTGLLTSTLAQLPTYDGIDVQERIRVRLFEPDLGAVMQVQGPMDTREFSAKRSHLLALININKAGMKVPGSTATRMFDEIVAWAPQSGDEKDSFNASFIKEFNSETRRLGGTLLSSVVVPSMPADDRTEPRVRALLEFLTKTGSWAGLTALPFFAPSVPSATNDIVAIVRSSLVSAGFQRPGSAALAIVEWSKLVREGVLLDVPRLLIEQLLTTIEMNPEAGLQAMLGAAQSLLEDGSLIEGDLERLTRAIGQIRQQFPYDQVRFDSARAVSISLVHAECVKLAVALKGKVADDGTLQAWVEEARADPLPEVRFSLPRRETIESEGR